MASSEFGRYVRPVEGFAVPRYGSTELIGAQRQPLTREQKTNGDSPVVWCSRIVPLPDDFCRKYVQQIMRHLVNGELEECTREEWEAQCANDAVEAENDAAIAAAAATQKAATEAEKAD